MTTTSLTFDISENERLIEVAKAANDTDSLAAIHGKLEQLYRQLTLAKMQESHEKEA